MAKEPLRCKLEVNGDIVEQVNKFTYLGSEIISTGDLREEVKRQMMKASQTAGRLKDLVWKNKYLTIEGETRIYKTAVRPILTYTTETKADTSRTIQMMRTTEIKVIRGIHRKTLLDQIRSEEFRQLSNIQDVTKWIRRRRKEWNRHVDRRDDDNIVKPRVQKIPRRMLDVHIGRGRIGQNTLEPTYREVHKKERRRRKNG